MVRGRGGREALGLAGSQGWSDTAEGMDGPWKENRRFAFHEIGCGEAWVSRVPTLEPHLERKGWSVEGVVAKPWVSRVPKAGATPLREWMARGRKTGGSPSTK